MHFLDREAPGLASQLKLMSSTKRRRVLADLCLAASNRIAELEPSIRRLLDVAARDLCLSPSEVDELRVFGDSADDRYFTLKESGAAKAQWSNWFSKARLASALISAFDGASWEGAADAAYELCFVGGDNAEAVLLVRSFIESAV